MQRNILLLLATCALAAALPRNTRLVESEFVELEDELSTTTITHTTPMPTTAPIAPPTTSTLTTSTVTTTPMPTTTPIPPMTTTTPVPPMPTTTFITPPTTSTTTPTTTTEETEEPESKVIDIKTASELERQLALAGEKLVLLFAMASWCGSSRSAIPTVEDIARTEDLIVLKIDVDKTEDDGTGTAWRYGVTGVGAVPTFILVKKGIKLEQFAGSGSKRLHRYINKHLSS